MSNKENTLLPAPSLDKENPPIYLESNPLKDGEMMIVTGKNDIYIFSEGQEEKWNKILSNGETE